MLIYEGKKKIIETFLNSSDLYLGLWSSPFSTGKIFTGNNLIMKDFSFYEIKDLKEYKRIKVSKSSWVLEDPINLYYISNSITYTPIQQVWFNISGYFLTTTETGDSGKLIGYLFLKTFTLNKNIPFVIFPRIKG